MKRPRRGFIRLERLWRGPVMSVHEMGGLLGRILMARLTKGGRARNENGIAHLIGVIALLAVSQERETIWGKSPLNGGIGRGSCLRNFGNAAHRLEFTGWANARWRQT